MILGFLKGFNVDGKRKPTNFEEKIKKRIKLHTIRWDQKNRWDTGRLIHYATGVRTSKYNCFRKGLCTGTQKISIVRRNIFVGDNIVPLDQSEIQYLSDNDGFDSIDDFWWWFDQYSPFTGKIIHWTDLRY